jgi:hypothetical protein
VRFSRGLFSGTTYPAAAEVRISTMWYLWIALIIVLFFVASPVVKIARHDGQAVLFRLLTTVS